jgi:hypothetical protein
VLEPIIQDGWTDGWMGRQTEKRGSCSCEFINMHAASSAYCAHFLFASIQIIPSCLYVHNKLGPLLAGQDTIPQDVSNFTSKQVSDLVL